MPVELDFITGVESAQDGIGIEEIVRENMNKKVIMTVLHHMKFDAS